MMIPLGAEGKAQGNLVNTVNSRPEYLTVAASIKLIVGKGRGGGLLKKGKFEGILAF